MPLALFFLAVAVFLAVLAAGRTMRSNPVAEILEGFGRGKGAVTEGARLGLARLGNMVARAPLVRDLVLPDRMEKNLKLAGYRYTVQEWFGIWALSTVGGAALGTAAARLAAGHGRLLPLVLTALLTTTGFFLPKGLLGGKVTRGRAEMEREFIIMAEKVALLSGAGIPVFKALEACAGGSYLGKEVARTVDDYEKGTPPENALDAFARRVDLPDVEDFVSTLKNALRYGPKELPRTLKRFVADMRHWRESRIDAISRTMENKLLFPVVGTVFPAFAIMVLGPIIIIIARAVFAVW